MKLKKLVILKTLDETLDEKSIYNYEYKNGKHSITEYKVPTPGWKEAIKELRKEFKQDMVELKEIILEGFKQVNVRLDKVEARLDAIENCPTIKKELIQNQKDKKKL